MAGHSFGDYKPQSVTGLTARQLKAIQKWGPQTAQIIQDISESIAPQEQALQLGLLQQFAPEYSKIGSDIATQEAEANVSRDLGLSRGTGRELASEATALDRLINPEFYASREAAGKGFTDLISGQDPNKLTGSEVANVERGVNRLNARTGNINTGDATTTASNAMLFGDELNKKRDRFGQALSLFPGIASASRSPVDAFGIATGKSATTPNFGQQQFQTQTGMATAGGLTGNALATQQNQQNILAGRRNIADYSEGAVGSVCCFIMIAASECIQLPWWIRFCRDFYYQKDIQVRKGYKRMANWLVPLMNKYYLVRKLVKYSMFYPLSFYGAYCMGLNKFGFIFKPIKSFWFNIWRTI